MSANRPRDFYFDNAKFILMVLVVVGHFMGLMEGRVISQIHTFIYIFHMPCFVFITGYFTNPNKEPKILGLAIKFVVFQFILFTINRYVNGGNISLQFVYPHIGLWYLLACLFWRLITPKIINIPNIIIITLTMGILIGYVPFIGKFLALSRVFYFLPFFLAGCLAKREHLEKVKACKAIWGYLVLIAVLLAVIFSGRAPSEIFMAAEPYQLLKINQGYAFMYRMFTYAATIITSLAFFVIVPSDKNWYTEMGSRTLQVYLLHLIVVCIIDNYGIGPNFNGCFSKAIFALSGLLLAIVLNTKPFEILLKPLAVLETYLTNIIENNGD